MGCGRFKNCKGLIKPDWKVTFIPTLKKIEDKMKLP